MLNLSRILLQSVECNPNVLAIVDGDLKLSHARWLTHIQSVAVNLLDPDLHSDEHLLTIPQNRWEMAVLRWARQLTRTVTVPLNWRAKPDELNYCVRDADAKALVSEPVGVDTVPGSPTVMKILRIALDGVPHSSLSFDTPLGAVPRSDSVLPEADDVSLVLYTSSITGRSGSVPRRHRQEYAAALAHVTRSLYWRGERTLGVMPLYHIMGVRSLLVMALVDGLFVCVRRWSPSQTL